MKKRMKKKLAKCNRYHGYINAVGNNGGDFIEIKDNMDGTVHLRVGSCCVLAIDQVVPVEFLSAIISNAMMTHGDDVKKIIDGFMWSKEFKEQLKAKCYRP